MIVRHGQVALEQYFGSAGPNTRREIYSVTKSFMATLIGIAIDQGLIQDVNTPVLSFFPERSVQNPSPEKDSMTLKHVLTMSTGFRWSENDINRMYSSPDWTQFMLDLPVVEKPGTRFNYCTGCSHLLSAILAQATGMDARSFAEQFLFEPLGIRNAQWLTSSEGLPIGGWGLQLTTPDLARLGYLYLRRGVWDTRLLLSNYWIQAATFPYIQADAQQNYGYQWWIRPSIHGYAALGRDGQMIAVTAEKDMVIVFTAAGVDHDVEFNLIEKYIMPAAH
jgi:CubicO group peptidase (beta-lactamase class C family)